MNKFLLALVTVAALVGCRSPYSWTSDVPQKLRTVAVPTFRNESDVTELGVLAATQILREFQREGTFKIARPDDAAVEVQGVITDVYVTSNGGDVRTGNRTTDCSLMMRAEVSVVERVNGRVLVDNKVYTANTTFIAGPIDLLTAERDASRRLAEDLAAQVVDDVLAVQW